MSGIGARQIEDRLAVYLVADPAHCRGSIVDIVVEALSGGVTSVQLRSKDTTDRETLALAHELNQRCRDAGALFIVNDRVDLAIAAGADGVHLGVDDLPLEAARQIGGRDLVIGYSPETDAQAAAARNRGADYLGVGPVYGTSTKLDAGGAIGLDVVRGRVQLAGIPVVGIGGITAGNAVEVIDAGAHGVAVVSAILSVADPRTAAESIATSVASRRSTR